MSPVTDGGVEARGPQPSSGALGPGGGGDPLWILCSFSQFHNLPHLCLSHANEPNRKSRHPPGISQQAQKPSCFRGIACKTVFVPHQLLEALLSPPPTTSTGGTPLLPESAPTHRVGWGAGSERVEMFKDFRVASDTNLLLKG